MRLVLLMGVFLMGCAQAPNMANPARVSKTPIDQHGVVCYTTSFRGGFSCVKVN